MFARTPKSRPKIRSLLQLEENCRHTGAELPGSVKVNEKSFRKSSTSKWFVNDCREIFSNVINADSAQRAASESLREAATSAVFSTFTDEDLELPPMDAAGCEANEGRIGWEGASAAKRRTLEKKMRMVTLDDIV